VTYWHLPQSLLLLLLLLLLPPRLLLLLLLLRPRLLLLLLCCGWAPQMSPSGVLLVALRLPASASPQKMSPLLTTRLRAWRRHWVCS
jgi:hypothetical protein